MIVAKFGGTSVSSVSRILTISQIVESEIKKDPIIVVSALSGVTDLLLSLHSLAKYRVWFTLRQIKELHKNLIIKIFKSNSDQKRIMQYIDLKINEISKINLKKNDKKTQDKLVSFGEIMSSFIVTESLLQKGIKAQQVVATDLIVTNDNFTSADFLINPTQKKVKKVLLPLISKKIVPVISGFIASNRSGDTTTLGRGGSDYTASIIGFCLGVSEIQIWTDVDGIFNADPRLIKKAKALPVISFREASELATFGAKVLHPRTIRPAIKTGIPVRVLNTFNPQGKGTLIVKRTVNTNKIKAISFKRKITLVNIYSTEMLLQKGFLAKIFTIFAKYNISIDLVSVSEVSVSVTLDNKENLEEAIMELSKFSKVSTFEDLGMVSLIGGGITDSTNNINNIFNTLHRKRILAKMVSLGATNINISIVLESKNVERAVKALHRALLQ